MCVYIYIYIYIYAKLISVVSVNFPAKIKAVIFVSKFLYLLNNWCLYTRFKISLRFPDDNIWLAAKNLKDQNT